MGPKTAERLAFYLLHVPETEIEKFGSAVLSLKKGIVLCRECKNTTESDEGELCLFCQDHSRDKKTICIVQSPLDVFSLEKTGKYRGLYHVLHGVIDPLHNIGPEELYIDDLVKRIDRNQTLDSRPKIQEVILALNPTMEGEATAMYIHKKLKVKREKLKVTRLGVGMPIGGDIQYADETTLAKALEGRRDYE